MKPFLPQRKGQMNPVLLEMTLRQLINSEHRIIALLAKSLYEELLDIENKKSEKPR